MVNNERYYIEKWCKACYLSSLVQTILAKSHLINECSCFLSFWHGGSLGNSCFLWFQYIDAFVILLMLYFTIKDVLICYLSQPGIYLHITLGYVVVILFVFCRLDAWGLWVPFYSWPWPLASMTLLWTWCWFGFLIPYSCIPSFLLVSIVLFLVRGIWLSICLLLVFSIYV